MLFFVLLQPKLSFLHSLYFGLSFTHQGGFSLLPSLTNTNMFPSIPAISAALLSLLAITEATPQAFTSSSAVAPSASATQASSPSSTAACNNSPDLCNRNYNNITHMGTHNAAFLRDSTTSFSTSGNQFYNATVSLDAGIRLLQAQVHNVNGTARLCHSSCSLLDAGPLVDWLSEINTWMGRNPNDVVTLILVNADDMSAAQFGTVFTSSRISQYGYTPSSIGAISTWPTLQTLITANTRLVSFIASIDYDPTYPFLLPEFDYVFETAFGVTSMDGFNCTLDRPSTQDSSLGAVANGYLGLVNHFLDVAQSFFQTPDVDNLSTTNSASSGTRGSLATQSERCQREWGIKPTFVLVNFFNVGPAVKAADQINGITPVGRKNLTTAVLDSTSPAVRTDAAGCSMIFVMCLSVMAFGNFLWL